jgi:hypothetical protein
MGYDSFIGNDPDHPRHPTMTTTTAFIVTRAYRTTTTPWAICEHCWDSATPLTQQAALNIAQATDCANSKTLSIRPAA